MARFDQANAATVFICEGEVLKECEIKRKIYEKEVNIIAKKGGGDSERKQESHRESDDKKKKKILGTQWRMACSS